MTSGTRWDKNDICVRTRPIVRWSATGSKCASGSRIPRRFVTSAVLSIPHIAGTSELIALGRFRDERHSPWWTLPSEYHQTIWPALVAMLALLAAAQPAAAQVTETGTIEFRPGPAGLPIPAQRRRQRDRHRDQTRGRVRRARPALLVGLAPSAHYIVTTELTASRPARNENVLVRSGQTDCPRSASRSAASPNRFRSPPSRRSSTRGARRRVRTSRCS